MGRETGGPCGRYLAAMSDRLSIVVLDGDETGQELLEQALRVLEPDVIGLELDLPHFDLSLEHRRATANAVVHEAAAAMREAGYGLKAATVTPEGKDDVGSPNRILREEVDGTVIIRTGRRIPGITPIASRIHSIASTSRMRGTLRTTTSSSVRMLAARMGSAPFLFPAGMSVPESGTPPSITNFCMSGSRARRACRATAARRLARVTATVGNQFAQRLASPPPLDAPTR